jgi:hypothetical protein
MRFKIPATTPPGAYLVRFENFMPTTSWHYVQFYINCALVHIHSPPNTVEGVPTGFLKFPAEGGKSPYDLDEPSMLMPPITFASFEDRANVYYPSRFLVTCRPGQWLARAVTSFELQASGATCVDGLRL